MRKSILIFLCLAIPFIASAQDNEKHQEAGIVFYKLDNFGFIYKTGTAGSLWRFQALSVTNSNNSSERDSVINSTHQTGLSLSVGKEFRKEITQQLTFTYGADLNYTFSRSSSEKEDLRLSTNNQTTTQTTMSPSVNLIFGLNYGINEHFIIGAELLPYFSYARTKTVTGSEEYFNDRTNAGLLTGNVRFTLGYRF